MSIMAKPVRACRISRRGPALDGGSYFPTSQVIDLARGKPDCGFVYWVQAMGMARRSKAFCWRGGGPGEDGEGAVGSDGGDDRVAGEGREVGQQALETVDGGAIGGSSGGLLGDGAWRALRLGDRTVAQRRGGVLVVVVIEHRG